MAAVAITLPNEPHREVVDAYDDGRAAERMLIAACWLGLGAAVAWVRPDVHEAIHRILRLPADRMVRTIMVLGHPTEAALRPKNPPGQARLPRSEVIEEFRPER
jgi:predicted oxidoreductase (fatty acid repression mutant protein)